jgi:hypothetical protein
MSPTFLPTAGLLTLLPLLTLLSPGCAAAPPRDYCFSPTGDDSAGDGTAARPYQTIDKANSLTVNPGDRILFQAGEKFTGNLELDSHGGTEKLPVIIGSYGQGRAAIDAEEGSAVAVHNAGGVIVRDLIVYGSGRGMNWGAGVVFFNDKIWGAHLDDIRIENVDASGFQFEGILVRGMAEDGSSGGYRHVRIVGCKSHHNLHTGIFITGWWHKGSTSYANQDVYIGYCETSENSGDPDSPDETRSGSGIFVEAADGVVIEHCLARGNGRLCAGLRGGPVGIWCSICRNALIQFNKSCDNHTCGSYDGGGFCLDGGVLDSTVQFNASENNDGSGYGVYAFDGSPPTVHNTVRWNTSSNDGRRNGYAGIHLWNGGGGVRDVDITHNTVTTSSVADAPPRCVWLQSETDDVRFHDNLFATAGASVRCVESAAPQDSVLFYGNQYLSTGSPPAVYWNGVTCTANAAWESALHRAGR